MVAVGKIREWVKRVNAEYGLSDKNEASIDFFTKIAPLCEFIETKEYYIVGMVAPDMWGVPYLSIVSFYILPEYRTAKTFKKLQEDIISLAKIKKVGYIIQGSHLNDKLHRVLGKMGYKVASMRRDI